MICKLQNRKVKSSDIDFGLIRGTQAKAVVFRIHRSKIDEWLLQPRRFFRVWTLSLARARRGAASLTATFLDADHRRKLTETAMASKA